MAKEHPKQRPDLKAENAALRERLAEAEGELLRLQSNVVDAALIEGPDGEPVLTLQAAAESYRTLIETMNEGAVTLTNNGTVLYSNLRFAHILGVPIENVIGKSFFEFICLGWNERFFDFLQASRWGAQQQEISLSRGKGHEVSVLLSSSAFAIEGKVGISLAVTDITTRKLMEETLRRTEERLHTIAEMTSDAVWEFDPANNQLWRSDGFAALLGYPTHAVKDTPNWWKRSIHPDDRSLVFAELDRLLKTGQGSFHKAYRLRRADGTYAEVIDRAVAIRDENRKTFRLIGTLVDVTEQNKAETAKRELSKKVLDAQERERQRVARELHDSVNQLLASTTYRLHTVEEQVARKDKSLARKVGQAKELVERAIAEVRLISRNLRPSELDDLGLNAALRTLCAEFEDRSGIDVQIEAGTFGKPVPQDVELTIYRIAQEALNNVQKHAHAKIVQISLRRESSALRMKIRDDGKGFDPEQVRKGSQSGWGLENMRERVSFFGGTLKINSVLQKGTEINLHIPIN